MLTNIKHGENIGMVQGSDSACLLLEAMQSIGFAGEGFRKDLYRDIAAQAGVPSAIDLSHDAGTERGANFIRSKFCARSQGHMCAQL